MSPTVDMGRAAVVVAWEQGLDLGNANLVRLLQAAEEGVVHVALVRGVAIAEGDDAGIHALVRQHLSSSNKRTIGAYGRVALPEVQVDVRHGLAGPRVDHLHVQIERHALLVLGDVAADKLAGDVCAR